MFYIKFPDITNNNYLFHKLIIFILTFVLKFVAELIRKIKDKKKVDPGEILYDSINYSLYNIVGYSIYIDLMYMNIDCKSICINVNSDNQRYLIASAITTTFVSIVAFGKKMVSENKNFL